MYKEVKFHKKISVRILAILIALFILAGAGIITLNYYTMRKVYVNSLNEKVLVCNALAAELLDADDVASYVTRLTLMNDEFKAEQIRYNENRERLFNLQLSGTDEQGQSEAIAQMKAFQDNMKQYRKDTYIFNLRQMDRLKTMIGAKYLYVAAFTGVVDEYNTPMLTYIYDTMDLNAFDSPDCDGLGTAAYFDQAAFDILFAKQKMSAAIYSEDTMYGKRYYAYSPITDANDNVIALIGTDIETVEMNTMLNRSVLINSVIFLLLFISAIGFLYLYISLSLIRPVKHLTDTAERLADGDIDADVNKNITDIENELGILAKSISGMGGVYRDMILSTGSLFEAANSGRLDVRNDPSRFKGGIGKVVEQINDTLDATTMYLNCMPECLFLINRRFEIMFANSMFKECFGEGHDREIVATVLTGDKLASDDLLNGALLSSLSCNSPLRRWINGKYYSVMIREIDVVEGERSILIIATDVTDLENEKINAQAANASKSEFLSRVSHELRTPMNVILGMSSLGLKEGADAKSTERFKNIDSASKYLLTIINDVLDMSRIESGKMEIRNVVFNLPKMIDDCRIMFEGSAAEKAITFKLQVDANVPVNVETDGERLKQVLINLLSNSFKFTESGGRVDVCVRAKGEADGKTLLELDVADTGSGMSAEFLERVFKPFEQESKFLQRKYKGTGLGLSISKFLINLMGGDISVISKEGVGSKFTVNLPVVTVADDVTDEKLQTESFSADIKGMRVMLVDDIEINRLIFMEMFEDSGIKITELCDGTEAVETFVSSEPFSYDIIFMDIQMLKMDGYEATRRIRALDRPDSNIPIIAMTANALKQDMDNALECGMNGHIAKPIDYFICLNEMSKYFNKK